ncbi:hypothetical protein A9986_18180 [Solibacillus silvestris]|nr:hypothetical protein A9986_18180 [Solibacillus silvestris]
MYDSPILCITSIYVNFHEKFHAVAANYNAKHCDYSNLSLPENKRTAFRQQKMPFYAQKDTFCKSTIGGETSHPHKLCMSLMINYPKSFNLKHFLYFQ